MSLSVQVGLLLAVATALTSTFGFLYKWRGAVRAPAVDFRRPVRSSLALFHSGWYALGIGVALGSWGLHVAALSLAPISLVQSVIAGGLVLLTVVAERAFGFEVSRREWIGVALAGLGLAFLAATLEGAGDSAHSEFEPGAIAAYVTIAAMAGLALSAIAGGRHHAGVLFGASAGLLWGASDVSIKGASSNLGEGLATLLINPLALTILVLSLIGLLVSAKSLQIGDAVPVIAVTSVTANTVTIAAGPIVFGDPMPDDSLGLIARLLAFALVITAAALTPAPMRPDIEPELKPVPAGGG
jgi:hypothetical protein